MQLVANSFSIARFCAGHKFLLLVLIVAFQVNSIAAQRSCYQCEGINCQRTTYQKVEKCSNDVDICATVFEGRKFGLGCRG